MSIERLKAIITDNGIGKTGKEYNLDELAQLLWGKETAKVEQEAKQLEQQMDSMPQQLTQDQIEKDWLAVLEHNDPKLIEEFNATFGA